MGGAGRAGSTQEISFASPKGQESQTQFTASVYWYHFQNEIPCTERNTLMKQSRGFLLSTMDTSMSHNMTCLKQSFASGPLRISFFVIPLETCSRSTVGIKSTTVYVLYPLLSDFKQKW